MALTLKLEDNAPAGALQVRRVKVTGDNSYATGGYAIAASDFGFNTLIAVLPLGGQAGYTTEWNPSTGKLLFYRTGTSANTVLNEVTAAVNLSAVSEWLLGIGY